MLSLSNPLGQTLGGYKLIELIGSGAMATVFKAHQLTLDRWVALKILHYKDKEALLRFQREARAIALLRHQNILIVYEYGEEGWPYIAMEYVEGGSLSAYLAKNSVDWSKAVHLLIPVAEALHYAHQQGIIHRDVKPSNILLSDQEWPLLADFGLVKISTGPDQPVTQSGASMGTPAYIAPEQARGMAVDHRVDIYSLGVVLYEMVTGRLPFNYSNINKMLLAHISEPPPPPRLFNPQSPADLERVILKAMRKLPAERYQNMDQMISVLKEVITSTPTLPKVEALPAASGPSLQDLDKLPSRLEACLRLPAKELTLPVPAKDNVIIGRTHRDIIADIDLGPYGGAQLGISRRHACLIWQNQRWFIDDLDSLNGTYVNNIQIKPGYPIPLQEGDQIRCSHMNLVFLLSPANS
jgi:eukaryotic-like serine/threonine-protein kinase